MFKKLISFFSKKKVVNDGLPTGDPKCKHLRTGWCWLAQRVEFRRCLDCGAEEVCDGNGDFHILTRGGAKGPASQDSIFS